MAAGLGHQHRSRADDESVSFLRAGYEAMLSAQLDGAKVMPIYARHSVREIRRARADRKVADLAPVISELRAAGVTSLRGIALALNARGIPTLAGSTRWHHVQVARVLARLEA
jgi:hypothetical protein